MHGVDDAQENVNVRPIAHLLQMDTKGLSDSCAKANVHQRINEVLSPT